MKTPQFIEKFLESSGFIRKEKAAIPSVSAGASSDPFTIWRTNKKGVDPARAMEVYTGWVYAAIRAIAMEIGSMELRLFKAGKDTDVELFEHEILSLLGGVNEYQTSLELFYTTAAHLEATGNAYWFLEGADSETSKPTAIHMLIPSKVKPIVNREEFPMRVQGYEYRLGSKRYTFMPYQVLHIKYVDPSDPIEGIGTVQSIGQWIDADNHAMEFNRRFFLNGARIGGTLATDAALTQDQLEYLKVSFEAAFKGVDNAYKTLALPKGVTYEEGGRTQKDLDFSNLMLIMRDRIIAGFRVPRTALGITDDVNRANAEATDYVFAARTIKPIMRIITTYLNEFLVPRFGDTLYLDFKDPVPEDRMQRVDERSKSLGGAAWKTTNEARAEDGLDPIDGGDVVLAPFNLTPIGSVQMAPQEPKQVSKGNGKPTLKRTRYAINAQHRHEISKGLVAKAMEGVKAVLEDVEAIKAKGRKDITQLTDDQYEAVYKGFAIRVDKYERRQENVIKDANLKVRKEVLDNLPKIAKGFMASGLKSIDKGDLFDLEDGIRLLVDLTDPVFLDLAQQEGKEAAALLGVNDMDILTPSVRRALNRAADLMSRSYNTTTIELLKAKLEEGLVEGMGQDELADLINGVFDYSDETRALAVARTETFRIANYATQEAWKQGGVVKSQRWFTAADERVCPYCGPLNGKIVSIDADFFKKGDEVTGSDGSKFTVDYSNVNSPPLHVSCRCYIRPEEISLE